MRVCARVCVRANKRPVPTGAVFSSIAFGISRFDVIGKFLFNSYMEIIVCIIRPYASKLFKTSILISTHVVSYLTVAHVLFVGQRLTSAVNLRSY